MCSSRRISSRCRLSRPCLRRSLMHSKASLATLRYATRSPASTHLPRRPRERHRYQLDRGNARSCPSLMCHSTRRWHPRCTTTSASSLWRRWAPRTDHTGDDRTRRAARRTFERRTTRCRRCRQVPIVLPRHEQAGKAVTPADWEASARRAASAGSTWWRHSSPSVRLQLRRL